ncbi:hypothetical protein BDY19DRAFT_621765 [Irpex rosettiformis]|uniref:Uncharacterized protein n=1 Tax=Irpex rosettiformis TaxID=378272 RepID=A0ACB8TNT4_9APHY|nr:hypothetical protein BDY19DRAFT_621765 [Irpex rosettiformis]
MRTLMGEYNNRNPILLRTCISEHGTCADIQQTERPSIPSFFPSLRASCPDRIILLDPACLNSRNTVYRTCQE